VSVDVGEHGSELRAAVLFLARESPEPLDADGVLDVRRVRPREPTQRIDEEPRVAYEYRFVAPQLLEGLAGAVGRDLLERIALNLGVVVLDLFDGFDSLEVLRASRTLPSLPVTNQMAMSESASADGK